MFTSLWEDSNTYQPSLTIKLTVVAIAGVLEGYLNDVTVFKLLDPDLVEGKVGLYCSSNGTARFSQVLVHSSDYLFNGWLLNESFNVLDLSRWTYEDEGFINAPSNWQLQTGKLCQTSLISDGSTDPADLTKAGTYALAGNKNWSDYRLCVRLQSQNTDDQ
ncbi:MAG: hypothetical protein ABIN89_27130 [Chitinophagaceae bacterium]